MSQAPAALAIYLLGPPRLERNGQAVEVDTRKAIALLAYLALHPERLSRDQLAAFLWPDYDQVRAYANLRRTLWALNKAVGEGWIMADNLSLELRQQESVWIDVVAFRRLLTQCAGHGHRSDEVCPACLEPLGQTVNLVRGDFLAGFSLRDSAAFDDWCFFEAESIRKAVATSLAKLVQGHSRQQENETAIGYARRWLVLDPLHEPAHRWLMQLYAQTGEQAAAVRQYQECVRILKAELDVPPDAETTALYAQICKNRAGEVRTRQREKAVGDTPAFHGDAPFFSAAVATPPHNLPAPLTTLIGRESEIAELHRLLTTTRLLTITGAGGSGKTRLALAVVHGLAVEAAATTSTFAGGMWWVELAAVTDPALLPQAVATVVKVREQPGRALLELLIDHLRVQPLLLVLDNCEHLILACAQLVTHLLRSCPQLTILTTSREALGTLGESTWLTPGLSLPDRRGAPTLAQARQSAAVQLFQARAGALLPTFTLTDHNLSAVMQICQQLDGMPLAIELAAARVKVLGVEQIAKHLADALGTRFKLLTAGNRTAPPRQQTLWATLDWSYTLLSAEEQRLFQGLAVFAGSFSLAAAAAIWAPLFSAPLPEAAADPLDLLSRLVDKSLVVVEHAAAHEARYRLLETIRQYAWERLVQQGNAEIVQRAHAQYYLALAEVAEPHLLGAEQQQWLDRLELEHDNLRATLTWSGTESDRCELGLRLAGALARFWNRRGYLNEGREWLAELLAGSKCVSNAIRLKALDAASSLAINLGDYQRARLWCQESLVLARAVEDKTQIAWSLYGLGFIAQNQGNFGEAATLFQESLSLFRELGDKRGMAFATSWLGDIALSRNDSIQAKTLYNEGLALFQEVDDKLAIAGMHRDLGYVAMRQGEYAQATALLEESLFLARTLGNIPNIAHSLCSLGNMAWAQGDYVRAQELYEESLTLARKGEYEWVIARVLHELGRLACYQAGYAQAKVLYEQSLTLFRKMGDKLDIAYSLYRLGELAWLDGDAGLAQALYSEALSLQRELLDKPVIAYCLEGLAKIAATQEQRETASQLLGAATGLRNAIICHLPPVERPAHERTVAALSTALDEPTFAAAWTTGQAMPLEQAVELALAIPLGR